MKLLDRRGRELKIGDLVFVDEGTKLITWQIQAIEPAMDPKLPPNTLKVVMTANMLKPCADGVPSPMVLDLTKEDAEEMDRQRQQQKPRIVVPSEVTRKSH